MKDKTRKLISKRKARAKKIDKKINLNNKKLMIDKILSYNSTLSSGIEKYLYAQKNFCVLIILAILLMDFPLIALPCCLLAMIFSVRMFQLIKYKSINIIVNELAKDLSFKGIYDQEKVDLMLDDFKNKYGENVSEYEELANMIYDYKSFVVKIENLLKNVNTTLDIDTIESIKEYDSSEDSRISFNKDNSRIVSNIKNKTIFDGWEQDENEELSILYRKEDGEVKKVKKAIEFLEDDSSYNGKAVVLKSTNRNNDKLTVYVYKKSLDLQKNAL